MAVGESMTAFQSSDAIGDLVARCESLSGLFEKEGIDYCCGGRETLDDACRKKGIDVKQFLARLEEMSLEEGVATPSCSLTELIDHIETTHHQYLRSELPRLGELVKKVSSAHGEKDPRLREVAKAFFPMAEELLGHMLKEEQILFPMARELEVGESVPEFHCGSVANPIRQMESEHDQAGAALELLRELTDGYVPPDWACRSYQAMLSALADLEYDLHRHIHKENNVLFPRVLKMETGKRF